MSKAQINLQAAHDAIEKAQGRIAVLEGDTQHGADPQLAGDLATERNNLALAEEVRSVSALQMLAEAVDEHARELMILNQRSRHLLEGIQGFLKMEVPINGQARRPDTSRLISAALLEVDESSDDAIADATAHWRSRFDALLESPDAELR